MPSYDIIIVGTGTAGSAACLELARRGVKVLGLDAFSPPHELGSHHGRSRSIRRAYMEGTSYVPMALRTWELWRKLEQDSGETLLTTTGNLTIGRPEDSALSGFLKSARSYDIPHEELSAEEVRKRWPLLNPPDDFGAGLEVEAGVLFPEACIEALFSEAAKAGADLRTNEPLITWRADDEGVRITTAGGSYEAGRIVFTAGARNKKLLGDFAPPLQPKRVAVHWVTTPVGGAYDLGKYPVNFWQLPDGFEIYSLPVTEAGGRVKFAAHTKLKDCDPDTVERMVASSEQDEARSLLAEYIPGLAKNSMVSNTCLYTLSPDGEFVLGPLPEQPNVIVGAFAGHGFKFATVLGELLADISLGEQPQFDVAMFSPERF
jgi:sarcosine oxidase